MAQTYPPSAAAAANTVVAPPVAAPVCIVIDPDVLSDARVLATFEVLELRWV